VWFIEANSIFKPILWL